MIVADAVHCADAGENALAAAAEARHHVMRTRAEADHLVRVRRNRIDLHARSVRRNADIDQIRRGAIVIHDLNAIENRVRHQRAQFLLVAAQMRAVCDQNRDLLVRNAGAIHIVHQRRNHLVLAHPEARHIADDQTNAVARLQPVLQRRRVDRMIQRVIQRRGDALDCRKAIAVQLAQHVFLVQRNIDRPVAIAECIILHANASFECETVINMHAIIALCAAFVEQKRPLET